MRAGALFLFLGASLVARPVFATSCAPLEDVVHWIPLPGATVPPEVQVRLLVFSAAPGFIEPSPGVGEGLQLACDSPQGIRIVPTTLRREAGFRYESWIWSPREPLPVGAECAVATRDRVHTWFRVGETHDRQAPRTRGLRPSKAWPCEMRMERCPGGSGNVRLDFVDVGDDTGFGQLLVEVRSSAGGEPIDRSGAPEAVLTGDPELGDFGDCDLIGSFVFPPLGEKREMEFVLVDWTGKRSRPIGATLEGPATPFQATTLGRDNVAGEGKLRPLRALEGKRKWSRAERRELGVAVLLGLVLLAFGWVAARDGATERSDERR